MDDIKISSNRSFGIVFFVVFFLIALYPLIHNEEIRIWSNSFIFFTKLKVHSINFFSPSFLIFLFLIPIEPFLAGISAKIFFFLYKFYQSEI